MAFTAVISLRADQFTDAETVLARCGGMTASLFRYESGVEGLRITNGAGRVSLLPFQGQQIWDAELLGRPLGMRSMFEEPVATRDYLSTYGALFIHCGATAMGGPGPADRHPLHGELPNAPYRDVRLIAGEDEAGPFMAMTGLYRHKVAFSHDYVAEPLVTIRQGSARIAIEIGIRNRKQSAMELMYLAHINLRPVDGAVLIDAVPDDPRHMRVRSGLPPQLVPSPEYLALVEAVTAEPGRHRALVPGRRIDPELVFALDCVADASGWSHAMQLHPDGKADFVSHRPDELSHGLRWMARNGDQDALGLLLPATAEADGYTAEKAKGNLRIVPPQGVFRCGFAFGALDESDAERLRRGIEDTRSRRLAHRQGQEERGLRTR